MAYNYNDRRPEFIGWDELDERQRFLLTESKTFCMLPWTHIHAWPTGEVFPCCLAGPPGGTIGNLKENTLEEIWNNDPLKRIRKNMLNEQRSVACRRCYEQEESGFFSMRYSGNKHFGHHIKRIEETKEDGTLDEMNLNYWDIRFSNLCNLRCRSCGHTFSSNWYDDQANIVEHENGKECGKTWKKGNARINYAGKDENDIWQQLEPHIDNLEQVYFAGGEPLIMEEHYRLLNELIRRKKTGVRLIYNTNFSELRYKKTDVLELWKEFDRVSIGASLDAMGPRAEYIRKGTDWAQVEDNRRRMIETCPKVDFYISATLSIMNAKHLPDFHKLWVDMRLIRPQDFNVNILQDPPHYRIDVLTAQYKEEVKALYEEHIAWLEPQDNLKRATTGFRSAVHFMMENDKSHLLPKFWEKAEQLDQIRGECITDVLPELEALR